MRPILKTESERVAPRVLSPAERVSSPAALKWSLASLVLLSAVAGQALAQPPAVSAQPPATDEVRRAGRLRGGRRAQAADGALVRALNLTAEQRAEIERIRRETDERASAVGQRLRRARRALEESIYSAAVDDREVELRAREVSEAEAERVRLRAQTELRIRRLLTTEQLANFRELRRRAMLRAARQRRDRQRDPALPRRRAPGQPPPSN